MLDRPRDFRLIFIVSKKWRKYRACGKHQRVPLKRALWEQVSGHLASLTAYRPKIFGQKF